MEQLQDFIKTQLPNIKSNEFEIRIGKFDKGKFVPGISPQQFNTMVEKLDNATKISIEDYSFYKFPYKQRKNKTTGRTQWLKKNLLERLDLEELGIRVNLAEEETKQFSAIVQEFQIKNPTKFFSLEKVQLLRRKVRYTQRFGAWRLDLSQVQNLTYDNKIWTEKSVDYEFEIELVEKDNTIEDLEKYHNTLFAFVEEHPLKDYIKLVGSKFAGNQPKTLERANFNHLLSTPYSVTDKADGERALMLFSNDGVYLIDKKLNKTFFMNAIKSLDKTLLDGELLKNRFLAFDLLVYKGDDMRNQPLNKRHVALDKTKQSIKSNKFTVKKFYYNTGDKISFVKPIKRSLFEMADGLWSRKDKLFRYDLDGLIFTPVNEEYTMKSNIYKWKDDITIDVIVRTEKDRHNFFVRDRSKIVRLRGESAAIHEFAEDKNPIADNSIVEYRKENNEWIPMRVRLDKEQPNALLTALSAIKAIKQNITIQELKDLNIEDAGIKYTFHGKDKHVRNQEPDINYRKFHNKIKQDVLTLVDKEKNPKFLLDLATGKGADMVKWMNAGYTHVLAIDSSWEHIYGKNGFHDRYNKIKDTKLKGMEITIVWGDISKGIKSGATGLDKNEKQKVKDFFAKHGNIKFDTITCHFAIHYLLQNEKQFRGFSKNIKTLLDKEGTFIATYLNAHNLSKQKKFKANGEVIYEYKKLYDTIKIPKENVVEYYWDKDNKINEHRLSVKTYQWDNPIEEPVVYPEILYALFEQLGLKSVEKLPTKFSEYEGSDQLSDDEKQLSFMHNVLFLRK